MPFESGIHLWLKWSKGVERCVRPGCSALRRKNRPSTYHYRPDALYPDDWGKWRPFCRGGSTSDKARRSRG